MKELARLVNSVGTSTVCEDCSHNLREFTSLQPCSLVDRFALNGRALEKTGLIVSEKIEGTRYTLTVECPNRVIEKTAKRTPSRSLL